MCGPPPGSPSTGVDRLRPTSPRALLDRQRKQGRHHRPVPRRGREAGRRRRDPAGAAPRSGRSQGWPGAEPPLDLHIRGTSISNRIRPATPGDRDLLRPPGAYCGDGGARWPGPAGCSSPCICRSRRSASTGSTCASSAGHDWRPQFDRPRRTCCRWRARRIRVDAAADHRAGGAAALRRPARPPGGVMIGGPNPGYGYFPARIVTSFRTSGHSAAPAGRGTELPVAGGRFVPRRLSTSILTRRRSAPSGDRTASVSTAIRWPATPKTGHRSS